MNEVDSKKKSDLDFLINKILSCDLVFNEWSLEDQKRYEEIKKEYDIK